MVTRARAPGGSVMKSSEDGREVKSSTFQKIKRIVKYLLITILSLVILAVILLFVIFYKFASGDKEESDIRAKLSNEALNEIIAYHDKNGRYPKNLEKLPVYKNKKFVEYIDKREFNYYASDTNYSFSWRGGAMNWTGYSCSNLKGKHHQFGEENIIQTSHRPDGVVCTVTDLH